LGLTISRLPYALDGLEPHLSRRTLGAHHGSHYAAHIARTRFLTQGTALENASLETVIRERAGDNSSLSNAAAQAWNHEFYWMSLRRGGGGAAHGEIATLLEECYGSHKSFSQQFIAAAVDQFGSGWAWLVLDSQRLRIVTTSNAGTPLLSAQVPLLGLDLWEHAYYLDYQHRRLDYIAAFLAHLVNWDFANRNLAAARERVEAPDRVAVHS